MYKEELQQKKWKARTFSDKAIKESVTTDLENLARVLSGKHELAVTRAKSGKHLSRTEYVKTSDGGYVLKHPERYKCQCRIGNTGFTVMAKNMPQLWLKVIDFWIGSQTIYPCGAV